MGSPGEVEPLSSRTKTKPMDRAPRSATQQSGPEAELPTIKTPTPPTTSRTRTASPRAKTPTAQAQGIPPVRPKGPNAGVYSVSNQRGNEPSQPFERVVLGSPGLSAVPRAATPATTAAPTAASSSSVEVVASGSSVTVQVGERAFVLTRRDARALVDKLRAALNT